VVKTSLGRKVFVTLCRVVKFSIIGGVLGGILAFVMFRRGIPGENVGAMLLVMIPTFALIGAILGAVDGFLWSLIRGFKK
jgi:ABC-type xylose transport system permease subunit